MIEDLITPKTKKRWRQVKLGDVAIINPKLPNRENFADNLEVQFLPMKLVEELTGRIHLTEIKTYGEVRKGYTPFVNNDIVFAKVTPCMENGKIAIVDNLKNGIGFGSSEFHVIRCGEQLYNKYAFYFLIQKSFRSEAEAAMTGAVGLRRVPKQFMENYVIPLPMMEEQQAIIMRLEEILADLNDGVAELHKAISKAEVLRRLILRSAFTEPT